MKRFLGPLLAFPLTLFAGIEDNSFLIEEAYNQEWGISQIIQSYQTTQVAKGYEYTFCQELPITDKVHQFSYQFSYARPDSQGHGAVSDLLLNYRLQPYNKDGVLVADRFGLIVPTGRVDKNAGNGVYGFEFMQAATINLSERFANHYNFGFDVLPNAKTNGIRFRRTLTSFTAGSSLVYLWKDNFNFFLEGLLFSGQNVNEDGTKSSETSLTLNPGIRFAWDIDFQKTQIVPGISFPTEMLNGPTEHGIFIYFSVEPKFI